MWSGYVVAQSMVFVCRYVNPRGISAPRERERDANDGPRSRGKKAAGMPHKAKRARGHDGESMHTPAK